MFKSTVCCGATLLFILSNVAVITLSWIIMGKTTAPMDPLSVHSTVAAELSEDWAKLPFVNITVIAQSTTPAKDCPSGWEPLFQREWAGTKKGCLIYQNTTNATVLDEYTYAMMTLSNQNLTCDFSIAAQDPVNMTNTNGFTICGLRGGQPYNNVTRVDPVSGLCPNGTQACSNVTSPDNTICYPQELVETSCPITNIFMTKNLTLATAMAKTKTWTGFPKKIASTWYLLYTKTLDYLPITTTSVEYKPCVNPAQLS
jgi:hypothetical protein